MGTKGSEPEDLHSTPALSSRRATAKEKEITFIIMMKYGGRGLWERLLRFSRQGGTGGKGKSRQLRGEEAIVLF